MRSQSHVCTALARRALGMLPDECTRDGEPARWFVQELLWALWLEVVDSLLDGPPLPEVVAVGWGGHPVAVSGNDWARFREEVGLHSPEIEDAVARLLGQQLFRPAARGVVRSIPLPEVLSGLVLLVCDLDQRKRSGGRLRFDIDPNLAAIVRQHPTPAGFGAPAALPPVDVVVDYAGLRSSARSGPLRVAYQSFYKPLLRRLEGRAWSPPAEEFTEQTVSKLRKAFEQRDSAPAEQPPSEAPVAPAPAPDAPGVRQDPPLGMSALVSLLDPVLTVPDDPLEVAKRARPDLGRRMCRALAEFLEGSAVEWYGRPGTKLVLSLPQSDWQLDKRSAVPLDAARPRPYLVIRWGLRLYGRVLTPARIVPDLEVPQ